MALYRYLAVSPGEASRELLIEADSEPEALQKLRSRRFQPVRYLGEESAVSESPFSLRRKRVDTYAFTRQLAPLLNSFIPLDRALGIIAESSSSEDQRTFVNGLRQGLHEGKKFSELIRSHGKIFPDYYANLIESGEETGCLPDVLTHLYKFMGESKDLRDFMVSSSIYPLAILSVTLLVTILLFTVFVPKFARIFDDMGRAMPSSMNFLLGMSAFWKYAWWGIPCLLLAARQIARSVLGRKEYDFRISEFKLSLPLIGRILADLEMCRYIRTLSILMANHVEIIRTVNISGRILRNPVISAAFRDIGKRLKGGEKLSAALKDNPYVPHEMVPMLRVGEESGSVGEMLFRIADNLENDTRLKIKRLLSLFEPCVIIVLAVMVLIVVASVFMAMMDINSISQGGTKL